MFLQLKLVARLSPDEVYLQSPRIKVLKSHLQKVESRKLLLAVPARKNLLLAGDSLKASNVPMRKI